LKQEVVYEEGSIGWHCYWVLYGTIRLTVNSPPVDVSRCAPDECFGEQFVLSGDQATHGAVATSSRTELLGVSRADLMDMISPTWPGLQEELAGSNAATQAKVELVRCPEEELDGELGERVTTTTTTMTDSLKGLGGAAVGATVSATVSATSIVTGGMIGGGNARRQAKKQANGQEEGLEMTSMSKRRGRGGGSPKPSRKPKKGAGWVPDLTSRQLLWRHHLIHPEDRWKIYLDLFIGVLVVYSVASVPYRIAFDIVSTTPGDLFLDFFVDVCFGADMLLKFRVAFRDHANR
jgi:hypothetical protein